MGSTSARWLTRPALFIIVAVVAMALYGSHARAVGPGQSVVGTGLLASAPQLIISSSGGNDVFLIAEGVNPAAYAGNQGGFGVTNGCAGTDTISDLGDATHASSSRNHDYSFGFTRPALSFSLVVLDWGDFLPFGVPANGVHGITLTGYGANDLPIVSKTVTFTSLSNAVSNRVSTGFGNLGTTGDACTASANLNEPGRLRLDIAAPAGTPIVRATLRFINRESTDPNIAITGLQYTLSGFGPPTDKDQCKDGGWQRFDVPRKFKNQGDCVSFTNNGR